MRSYLPTPALLAFALAAFIPLAGCGGGSAPAPSPSPSPTNRPPQFTSPATANVAENSTGTVYTATAGDPDGTSLAFSIAGGADGGLFQITSAGALSFRNPPDFEAPADADRNNSYLVQLGVSDGAASATLDLAITVTNAGPDSFRVTRVGTGFDQPVFLSNMGSSDTVLVTERTGRIWALNVTSGARTLVLDISARISTDGERGLLAAVLTGPDIVRDGLVIYYTNTAGDIVVDAYGDRRGGERLNLLTIPHPNFNNHNGGWLSFGPDGNLYIATGDGGGGGDPSNNAQNTDSLLGKILRISPGVNNLPGRNYGIPAGNPFAASGGRPEIWAYGLRNPFRNSFDSTTGNLLIGDVGQNAVEEIDLMRPTDGGANFGWRVMEGTSVFNGTPQPSFVPPVAQYGHGSGPLQGNSVTGGYVYRGPIESLRGLYIFGDFVSGNIWSVPVASLQLGQTLPSSSFTNRNAAFAPNAGAIDNVVSFGTDQAGNIYIVDFDGEIFRLEPS